MVFVFVLIFDVDKDDSNDCDGMLRWPWTVIARIPSNRMRIAIGRFEAIMLIVLDGGKLDDGVILTHSVVFFRKKSMLHH